MPGSSFCRAIGLGKLGEGYVCEGVCVILERGGFGACIHHFLEGDLELRHLGWSAYANADDVWPDGPGAADVDVLRAGDAVDLALGNFVLLGGEGESEGGDGG